jgi:hypothetical protein
MSCDPFADMASAFAVAAYSIFPRRVVFQRLPKAGETQTDDRGFPVVAYTDLDAAHPIPAIFAVSPGRELIIGGQQRSVTLYKFTVPSRYKTVDVDGIEAWKVVEFSPEYRCHLLSDSDGSDEQFLQVTGGGNDPGPDQSFNAVRTEEIV